MHMKKTWIALFLLVLTATSFAAEGEMYVNSSEPKFLRNIGPRDPRTDNPLAAFIVAVGVAGIIYKSYRAEMKQKEKEKRMDEI